MTDEKELSPEEKHRMNLIGLVLFLRQMTTQLIEHDQLEEARGLIDSLETLQVKTKGNTGPEEDRLLESVLFELRMAVVKGPDSPAPSPEEAPGPDASDETAPKKTEATEGE